jgi:hypothetical protein
MQRIVVVGLLLVSAAFSLGCGCCIPRFGGAPKKDAAEKRDPEVRPDERVEVDPQKKKRVDDPPPPPPVEEVPIDPEARVVFAYDGMMRFGLVVRKDAAGRPINKRLTFDPNGGSNSTVVRIDRQDFEFGGAAGAWRQRGARAGSQSRSVWSCRGVDITQILEIVPSKQPVEVAPGVRKRLLDTCLVRYELETKDNRDHQVALRVMIDTMIGSNDGVPFAVPTMRGMVNTFMDFNPADAVPDFVQALEIPNLQQPGTVGLMTLKLGGNVEPPDRVVLTAWPGFNFTPWEVPVRNMGGDSAVAIYWNIDRTLKPNEKRTFGFAYGLGRVSAGEGTGQLALTANGNFSPRAKFTITAYVQNPVKGQTLKLEVPLGMELVTGLETEQVPPPGAKGANTSIINWTLRAANQGKFQIRVRSSTGATQTQEVQIRAE